MKRLNEDTVEKSNKRIRPNTLDSWRCLPPEIWEMIVGHARHSGGLNLLSTSSLFAHTIRDEVKQAFFLDLLRKHIFDYADASEWKNCTQLPQVSMNRASFEQVISHFVTKLQVAVSIMEKGQSERSEFKNKLVFQSLLNNAIREGNLLVVKKLKQSFPLLMEICIDSVDRLQMNPFAYAAAFCRDGICCDILSQQCSPFEQEIIYDLGAAFCFAMRAIHVPALRSNKNLLLHIFDVYADSLGDVFEENFEEALQDILENRPESLKQKLAEDESLLQANDEGFWTLVQWASCFPESIDCLKLLLEQGAIKEHITSPPVTYIACAAGNLLALQTLIEAGEKMEPFMNNNNVLHLSVYNGHFNVMEYLITQDIKGINTENDREETPIRMARMTHNYGIRLSPDMLAKKARCVEILLANGAIEAANAVLENSDESDSESVYELEDLFRVR